MTPIRDAVPGDVELDALTRLWFDGWQDAHAAIVPAELRRRRTLKTFRERLAAAIGDIRVAGPPGAPRGFTMLKGDEVYQFFVSAAARGTGLAATLMADAEARLAARGFSATWLTCAVGNDRAARFYEKCGWKRAATVDETLDTPEGPFILTVWRYEKSLR